MNKHVSFLLLVAVLFQLSAFVSAASPKKNVCTHNGALVRCSTQYDGVCAYFEKEGTSKLAQRQTANGCVACSDDSTSYWIAGSCPGSKVYCDKKVLPEVCTAIYAPVCGYYKSKCGRILKKTLGSSCTACSEYDIIYYRNGEC